MKYKLYTFSAYQVNVELSLFGETNDAKEYHLMFHVNGDGISYETQLSHLQNAYREILMDNILEGAIPVMKRYFLSDAANQAELLEDELKLLPVCPTCILQQPPLDGSKIALWCYLTKSTNSAYKHYWVAGKGVSSGNSEEQTNILLHDYELELSQNNLKLENDCIRTWFFIQNIDVNYAGMVKARRENFAKEGLTEHTHYIASTGIEGRHANPGIHVLFDAYSVKGLQAGQIKYLYALNYLSPTAVYGVTFERGVCLLYGDRRQLYISGTASIDCNGAVVHKGDVVSQTARMCENIEQLLREGESGFEDLAQIIIYLRDASDYFFVKKILEDKFHQVPKQFVVAAVCRPTWLIEMECICIRKDRNDKYKNF
jgi:enamine deaminase RidA (YjgF/YER057c/UK114 family)